MPALLDPDRLPPALRPLIERALRDADGCEEAIAALEAHLAEGGREPDVLVALALVGYHESAELVLSRLALAAERALVLLDEALASGAPRTEALDRLYRSCERTLVVERKREERLRARVAVERAGPHEVVELAHRLIARGGEDALAAELLSRAGADGYERSASGGR